MGSNILEDKKNKIIKQWIILILLALLILLDTWKPLFALVAFGLLAPLIYFEEEEYVWMMLFFLMPLANIFKISADSTSLFTFLIFIFLFRLLLEKREVPALLLLFAIYMLIIPCLYFHFENFNTLRWIKLLCFILLMYFYFEPDKKRNESSIFLAYIVGLIISSCFRFADSDIFQISRFTQMDSVGGSGMSSDFINLDRFSGLYNDPNYYSVNLIIALCLIVILLHKKRIRYSVFMMFSFVLVYFAISTYSKSAILMLLLPVALLLYSNNQTQKYWMQFLILIIMFLGISYVIFGGSVDVLKVVIARFQASDGDINKLTTGRFNLWISYMNYLISHPKHLLFGIGIGGHLLNGRAAHNAYIEVLYFIGIIGGLLLFLILKQISNIACIGVRRNLLNYSILICILIMYFFLGELFYLDFAFHLIITISILNTEMADDAIKSSNRS